MIAVKFVTNEDDLQGRTYANRFQAAQPYNYRMITVTVADVPPQSRCWLLRRAADIAHTAITRVIQTVNLEWLLYFYSLTCPAWPMSRRSPR